MAVREEQALLWLKQPSAHARRVIKHLGCPHGCGEGHRSATAESVRRQAHACLLRLHRADESQFRRFLRELVRERSLAEVVDIYHALMGFCAETGSLLSPTSEGTIRAAVCCTPRGEHSFVLDCGRRS